MIRHALRSGATMVALALFAACSDVSGPSLDDMDLTIVGDTARPGTLLTAYVTGGTISASQVSGTLGDAQISFGRLDDTTLVALVPEVPAGARTLTLQYMGSTGTWAVTVLPAVAIANPLAATTTMLDAIVAEFPFSPPPGISGEQWSVHRAKLDSLVTDAKARLAAATPAEQLAVARLLESMDGESGVATARAMASLTGECVVAIASATLSTSALIASLGVGVAGLVPGIGWVMVPIGGALAFKVWPQVLVDVPNAFAACATQESFDYSSSTFLRAADASFANLNETLVFSPTTPLMIAVSERVTSLSKADLSDYDVFRFAGLLDRLHGVIEALPAAIAKLVPPVPPRMPETPTTTTQPVAPSQLSISDVQPTSVYVSVDKSGSRLALRAQSLAAGDIPFSFLLIKEGAGVVPWRRVNAVLKVGPDSTAIYGAAMLGTWSVIYYGSTSNTTYSLEVRAGGVGTYTVENGTTYPVTWQIRRDLAGRYSFVDYGFWNGHSALERDRLQLPVTSFTVYAGDGTAALRYVRQ